MPTARSGLGVTGMDGILYAIGGDLDSRVLGPTAWGTTCEAYNTATGQWTTISAMPTARYSLGVTGMDGILYAIGGDGSSGILDTA